MIDDDEIDIDSECSFGDSDISNQTLMEMFKLKKIKAKGPFEKNLSPLCG